MKKFFILFLIFVFVIFGQDKVIVVVGNKPVFESEIIYRSKRDKIDPSLALQILIEEKLLLYQAEKNKIEVSKKEIKDELNMIKKSFPSLEEFYEYLKQRQIKIQQLEQEIENNLKIRKLIRNEIISKIEITPFEIANEVKKIEQEYNEYEFFFKWFDSEKESERFVEKFNLDSLKEMDFAKLKSSEILDEIIEEISKLEKGKLTSPIKVGEKWIVIYLQDKKELNPDKIEKYRQAKDRIFKIKYSNLYKEYIEKLKKQIPIKFI
ncbi:MAG: SurA N-terminal domain-containing protein [Candidatus Omnitrophica bacterium]|nr:SurA N-terminal domain-containing protein [Candidatus Omnitrophota bacterium]MCM8802628.1 SurA N-terminal domain-containing protein [Candidatus Omnitrophota bacterium]